MLVSVVTGQRFTRIHSSMGTRFGSHGEKLQTLTLMGVKMSLSLKTLNIMDANIYGFTVYITLCVCSNTTEPEALANSSKTSIVVRRL